MSPTSYQTAPPREGIVTKSPEAVKRAMSQPAVAFPIGALLSPIIGNTITDSLSRNYRLIIADRQCRVDEPNVRERLGEIANEPLLIEVVFLGQKSDVIFQRGKFAKEISRVLSPSHAHVGI